MKAPRPIAARYYQLKIGHAIIGIHLKRIKSIDDDRCWWCNSGDRQTVKHLFKVCAQWRREREILAKEIKRGLWYHRDMSHMVADK
jgi:hypothetical protein